MNDTMIGNHKKFSFGIDKGVSDWIKFGAALMVVIHHYSQYALRTQFNNGFLYQIFAEYGGSIGVAIFFFFSGYGLMESEMKSHLSALRFLERRFLKIYLPVLLVTILWIGCYLAIYQDVNIVDSFADIMSPIRGGYGNLSQNCSLVSLTPYCGLSRF